MKRRPRALVVTTAIPTLGALLGAGLVEGCRDGGIRTSNPPPPPPPPRADAGAARLPPVRVDPNNLPPMPAGAIAPVMPHPIPSPAPQAALPTPSAAPSGLAAAVPAAAEAPPPAVAIVHNHPPGTPCTPIDRAALERAVGR